MDKDLAAGDLGAEAKWEVKIVDGKVRMEIGYDGKGVDGGVYMELESDYFLDKLADAIPGNVDDMVIAALKGAMK